MKFKEDDFYKEIFEHLAEAELQLRNREFKSAGTQCKIAMNKLYKKDKSDPFMNSPEFN